MKIKIETNKFLKSIQFVESIISVREIKSILSNLKLETINNKLHVSATDLEISMKSSIDATIQVEGTLYIPAKQLGNLLRTINFEEIILESTLVNNNYVVTITDASKISDSKFIINGIYGEDLNILSGIHKENVKKISSELLKESLRKTSYSVAIEDSRFIFNGLFINYKDGKLVFVGTDGRRLCKYEKETSESINFENGVIIPAKGIREINKLIQNNEELEFGIVDKQVYVSSRDTEILCKLIQGNFPDYTQVIPKTNKFSVKVNKDDFQIKLRQTLVAAEEPTKQIILTFINDKLNLFSQSIGTTEVSVNVKTDGFKGDEIKIAFKGDYLNDILKSIDGEILQIDFSDSNSPGIFLDPKDKSFLSVIMPMKI